MTLLLLAAAGHFSLTSTPPDAAMTHTSTMSRKRPAPKEGEQEVKKFHVISPPSRHYRYDMKANWKASQQVTVVHDALQR
jgi:hypothetical protein